MRAFLALRASSQAPTSSAINLRLSNRCTPVFEGRVIARCLKGQDTGVTRQSKIEGPTRGQVDHGGLEGGGPGWPGPSFLGTISSSERARHGRADKTRPFARVGRIDGPPRAVGQNPVECQIGTTA
jgi:hypothetical protein